MWEAFDEFTKEIKQEGVQEFCYKIHETSSKCKNCKKRYENYGHLVCLFALECIGNDFKDYSEKD